MRFGFFSSLKQPSSDGAGDENPTKAGRFCLGVLSWPQILLSTSLLNSLDFVKLRLYLQVARRQIKVGRSEQRVHFFRHHFKAGIPMRNTRFDVYC